jgi:hypothetical protein
MVFKNGAQVGSTATWSGSIGDIAAPVQIGAYATNYDYSNGWFDEFRVSKGIARWTSNFTPPTAPY